MNIVKKILWGLLGLVSGLIWGFSVWVWLEMAGFIHWGIMSISKNTGLIPFLLFGGMLAGLYASVTGGKRLRWGLHGSALALVLFWLVYELYQ
jgi:hypothetical protein